MMINKLLDIFVDIFIDTSIILSSIIVFGAFYFSTKYIYRLYKLNNLLIKNKLFIICDIPDKFKKIIRLLKINIFDMDDDDYIIDFLIKNKSNDISLILDTNGGSIVSNDAILNHIIESNFILNTYIIRKASSAGTLLALASDKLYMDENAYLTPTDPQLSISNQEYSIKSVMLLFQNKDINNISDINILEYYEFKKLYDENIRMINKLLNKKFKCNINKNDRNKIIKQLTEGDLSHHTPLNCRYLEKYIKIDKYIPIHIYDIYNMYFSLFY